MKLLSFSSAATAFGSARFGRGSGPIVMDNVACTGREERLVDCPSTFNHNCAHSEDAGVRCYNVIDSSKFIISVTFLKISYEKVKQKITSFLTL